MSTPKKLPFSTLDDTSIIVIKGNDIVKGEEVEFVMGRSGASLFEATTALIESDDIMEACKLVNDSRFLFSLFKPIIVKLGPATYKLMLNPRRHGFMSLNFEWKTKSAHLRHWQLYNSKGELIKDGYNEFRARVDHLFPEKGENLILKFNKPVESVKLI